ncbi:MAG: hypothetical protein RL205_1660 [Actinomycetota bacterium]|jgi:hypothetical protein
MPSPFRANQLSPEMRARYGLDRSNWPTLAIVVIVIVIFFAAVAWATVNMGKESVQSRLLTWKVTSPDTVSLEFEVRNPSKDPVFCVIRAQDGKHIDVGYSHVMIPPSGDYVRVPYELTTLAPAFTVELLGCAIGGEPNVSLPNFPPGVSPPQQK